MRAALGVWVVLLVPGLASAWAGSGLGTYVPPEPHDYSAREVRAGTIAADTFAPWCAFMAFGPDGPTEARVRIEPGAALPEGAVFEIEGATDPAMLERFTLCLRPSIAGLGGTFTGRRTVRRTYDLRRPTPRRAVGDAAGALVASHAAAIRACAPGGASITAIRLDVFRGEVRLDAVYVPTLDPRLATAGTGDGTVHDCVSAILSGSTMDARGRVYPVVALD